MIVGDLELVAVDDPALRAERAGTPLAIVAPGPSFDLVDRDALRARRLLVLNYAISELWREPRATWVCHDLQKAFRHGMRAELRRYVWRLATRRCLVSGPFGDVPWADKAGLHEEPHPWRARPPAGSTIYWYMDRPELGPCLRPDQTILEAALDLAELWGHDPVVLVGADLRHVGPEKRAYARPWSWKTCHITRGKFAAMRASVARNRARWRARVVSLSPWWADAPFERAAPERLRALLDGEA